MFAEIREGLLTSRETSLHIPRQLLDIVLGFAVGFLAVAILVDIIVSYVAWR